ncbi:MAG TPA: FtsX-like permease family protein [Candidatus Angelobacter sp.]|nr:FtsX-like permease family protein [Candidatus Angelobacter sp.]
MAVISKLEYFVPGTRLLTSFDDSDSGVRMWARLKRGATLKAAQAALQPLSDELARQHPDAIPKGLKLIGRNAGYVVNLGPEDADVLPIFGLVAALVLLILAAACGNLGNLLLGRAVGRENEMSIRLALGATRHRILRQLMTESLLLAMLGIAAGVFVSLLASRTLMLSLGGQGNLDWSPDWRTLLFAFAIGALSCMLFGLPSARQATRLIHRSSRIRIIFMAAQVAASCVLLVVGALLVRALHKALTADPGFDYQRVVTLDPQLYEHGFTPDKARQYFADLKTRLLQVPGVEAVALSTRPPLGNRRSMGERPDLGLTLYFSPTTPDFLRAMGISVLRGRDFQPNDQDAAIVSDIFARRMWPGKDPLRQTYSGYGGRTLAIIGVAADARTIDPRNGHGAEMYIPIVAADLPSAVAVVRVSSLPERMMPLLSEIAHEVDPALSATPQSLRVAYEKKVGESGKVAVIVSAMGMLALLLAAVGLYGVVSYNVARSTREIGIRIALGAPPNRLVRSMVSRFLLPLAIALSLGIILASALSMALRNLLYGIGTFDPLSYLAAAVLLIGIGGAAVLIPARRALKIDPMAALRIE